MKIICSFWLIILFFFGASFSQIATKVDVVDLSANRLQCGTTYKLDNIFLSLKENPQSKFYVLYYEAQFRSTSVHDAKTKKYVPKLIYPRFGDALNKAKEIPLYLKKVHKVPVNKVVLIDGGFQESLKLEVWSVPEDAEIPKATPTLERKDIKFAKGKPYRTRDLSRCYENY